MTLPHGGEDLQVDLQVEDLQAANYSQGGQASQREACLLQRGRASHRETRPLTGRQGLSQGGQSAHREASQLKGRPGLSQKSGPLLGRPILSQGGRASHREAGPLTGRMGL